MKREEDAFRMSDSGLEPVATERRSARARPGGSGLGDKKKLVVLLALAVVGAGVVGYQFLGGGSVKQAAAVTAVGAAAPIANPQDIEAILKGFDGAEARGAKDLTVDRVEELVKKFDGYVAERQVPLKDLRAGPFSVEIAPKAQAAETVESKPRAIQASDPVAEARAKAQRIRDAASRLVLGSILVAGSSRLAIINGNLCRVGDVVEEFQVGAIEPDQVRLSSEGETVDLRLPIGVRGSIKGSPNGH